MLSSSAINFERWTRAWTSTLDGSRTSVLLFCLTFQKLELIMKRVKVEDNSSKVTKQTNYTPLDHSSSCYYCYHYYYYYYYYYKRASSEELQGHFTKTMDGRRFDATSSKYLVSAQREYNFDS